MQDFITFPETTRMWIYQANQKFAPEVVQEVKTKIKGFVQQWVSHNQALRASGDLYHNQFVILIVDESQAGASGCSIDSSVHFLKYLQQEYEVDLFDRMSFTYLQDDTVKTAGREEFAKLYQAGAIDDETLVFDNLVSTKGAYESGWVKPLSESWHKRMV